MKIGKVQLPSGPTSRHWTPRDGRESLHISIYVQRLERERDWLKQRVEELERELEQVAN